MKAALCVQGLQGGLHRPDLLSKGGKSLHLSHILFCCKGSMSCSMVVSTEAALMLCIASLVPCHSVQRAKDFGMCHMITQQLIKFAWCCTLL